MTDTSTAIKVQSPKSRVALILACSVFLGITWVFLVVTGFFWMEDSLSKRDVSLLTLSGIHWLYFILTLGTISFTTIAIWVWGKRLLQHLQRATGEDNASSWRSLYANEEDFIGIPLFIVLATAVTVALGQTSYFWFAFPEVITGITYALAVSFLVLLCLSNCIQAYIYQPYSSDTEKSVSRSFLSVRYIGGFLWQAFMVVVLLLIIRGLFQTEFHRTEALLSKEVKIAPNTHQYSFESDIFIQALEFGAKQCQCSLQELNGPHLIQEPSGLVRFQEVKAQPLSYKGVKYFKVTVPVSHKGTTYQYQFLTRADRGLPYLKSYLE